MNCHLRRGSPALLVLLIPLLAQAAMSAPPARGADAVEQPGKLIATEKSAFSHIRVRDHQGFRSLYFVEPGLEVRQTSMELRNPGRLVTPYTRYMFASLLVKQPQERVLVVGLGGGAMVRFLNRHFPRTAIDALEIDPAVVKIAQRFFGTRASRRTRIFTVDAFDYLRRDTGRYDAIYMDAFLEPGPETDSRGIPQQLKTIQFLKSLHQRLQPNGVVAFNLSEHAGTRGDIRNIAAAFPTTYVFHVPQTQNWVVIASLDRQKRSPQELQDAGRALDRARRVGFSFEEMAEALKR